MKKFIVLITILFGFTDSFAQLNHKLSAQIDSLRAEDQKPASLTDGTAAETFQKVIRSNFPIIKHILDTYGFPGYDLVGKESADNFWLLVQHSDFDLLFQKRALKLMAQQVKKQNASGTYYAYLVDRIQLNEKNKQTYGTQITMTKDGYQPKPLQDSLRVDERRKAVGLEPIADYLDRANEAFNEMNKGRGHVLTRAEKDSIARHHQ